MRPQPKRDQDHARIIPILGETDDEARELEGELRNLIDERAGFESIRRILSA